MKKIIILKHGGGELANQLWNYTAIASYGLEIGVPVANPSFFEYHSFFTLLHHESLWTKFFSLFFRTTRRRSHPLNKIGRFLYLTIVQFILSTHKNSIFSSQNNENKVMYLPPTKPFVPNAEGTTKAYFIGWLWRNPEGLKKFRGELLQKFSPTDAIHQKIENILNPLRKTYENIIGIHIRQADYKIFKDGKYLVEQQRVREIIEEYLKEKKLDPKKTVFCIASDGSIEERFFSNLNIYISKENAVTDLFLLSRMDAILGSDSSFGAFASWFGNIPHVIFKKEPVDWEYYRGKTGYFENKYGNLVQY